MSKIIKEFSTSSEREDKEDQFKSLISGRSCCSIVIFSIVRLLQNQRIEEGVLRTSLRNTFCGTSIPTVLS